MQPIESNPLGDHPNRSVDLRVEGKELVERLAEWLEQSMVNNGHPTAEKVLDYQDEQSVYSDWKQIPPGQLTALELFQRVIKQSIRLHHPGFLGHQISPAAPVAALSGLVSDLLNNGMGVYEMGMAGTAIERVVVEMVADLLDFGPQASGVLTSGGSLGNLTALLTARNVKLPETIQQGTHAIRPAVMVSQQAHYCVQRAVAIMGWGTDGVVPVPVNDKFQMDTTQLANCLEQATDQGRQVIAVVGSASSTATGSYDDLNRIGRFCQQHDLWFHVDGAHGAAAAFSEKYRHLIAGIEHADSVVLDFHKLLLTPALATALVFRNGKDGYRTFAQKAEYLFSDDERDSQWHNIALRSFECTKLMMSLKVFSIYAIHGFRAWDDNVTGLFDMARQFAALVQQSDDLQLLVEPETNIVCYRFTAGPKDRLNEINQTIRDRLLREGNFYIVQTNLDGVHWLRSTVGSCTTTVETVKSLLQQVVTIGKSFT